MSSMLKKLSKQLNGEDWTWNNLNTLCWTIGSISGSMIEDQENRFLVTVIRDLLNLCEVTKGKDNKAVIASNIMYVVGQYPRFLRAHWKFLKTVVNKLFEFMHETHPGVQDMACDTFLKIVQKCKRKFVIVQVGEAEPFVSKLLTGLASTVVDLQSHQIHTFYESVGHMIQAESNPQKRDEYLQRLMELPNQKWAEIIGQARKSVDYLKDQEVIRTVLNIMQKNLYVPMITNYTQLWWIPNVIVAHQKEGLEAIHLASGRIVCKTKVSDGVSDDGSNEVLNQLVSYGS